MNCKVLFLLYLSNNDEISLVSGSQSVLWRSKGIHDQFPGDPWTHFCNNNFEVYLLFKSKEEGFC